MTQGWAQGNLVSMSQLTPDTTFEGAEISKMVGFKLICEGVEHRLVTSFNPAAGWWEEMELEDEPNREPRWLNTPRGNLRDVGRAGGPKIRNGAIVKRRLWGEYQVIDASGVVRYQS
jgi:hypothetical protein